MWYLIVPPIVLILSLAAIVVFLAKKAPKVKELSESEQNQTGNEGEAKKGFLGRIFSKESGGKIKNLSFSVLEKMARKLRMVFLEMENAFVKLSESVRKKKTGGENAKAEGENEKNAAGEDDIIKKIENYQPEKKNRPFIPKKPLFLEEEEKVFKPIISDRVVEPSPKAEIKDRLEDVLIERIASNPKDMEAYERLGEYYMEIESYDDAKECFKQVIRLNPGNRSVRYKIRKLERIMIR